MIFGKKNRKQIKCENCGALTEEKHSFCPNCGNNLLDPEKEQEDFGLLGKDDLTVPEENYHKIQGFGITDKLITSIMNSMMRSMDKQFKDQFKEMERDLEKTEVKSFPNGIRIKIAGPFNTNQKKKAKHSKKIVNHTINKKQLQKISSLPKTKAKTNVKRIGDKVVYELTTPGVKSPQDIFISKLESGYEIKAIGNKKIYVNSVPINLPLRRYSILKNKLQVEFLQENQQ
jgi:predicted  nucleic acid-binding Zn-ribbon protein